MLKIFPVETDEDIDVVKTLFIEYNDALGFDLSFQNFQEELVNLPGGYSSPTGCLLIAKYKSQAAGCVALRDLGDGVCEMKRLYVRPHFRRFKVGTALAEAIIDEARKLGYARMRLDTVPSMKVARKLYNSLGFVDIEPYRHNPIEGAVFMELDLETSE